MGIESLTVVYASCYFAACFPASSWYSAYAHGAGAAPFMPYRFFCFKFREQALHLFCRRQMSGNLGSIYHYQLICSEHFCVCLHVCWDMACSGVHPHPIECSYLVRDLPRGCMLVLQPAVARCIARIPISVPSWARSAPNDPVSQHTDL